MQAGFGSGVVGQLDRDNRDAQTGHRPSQLVQCLGVGAKAEADGHGVVVEPQQVAALGPGVAVQGVINGHAELLQAAGQGRLLAAAQVLAHTEHHRPGIGDQDRVVDIDGIGAIRLGPVVVKDLGAALAQQIVDAILRDGIEGDRLLVLAPVVRVTGWDTVMPYARLEGRYMPDAARIEAAVHRVMEFA